MSTENQNNLNEEYNISETTPIAPGISEETMARFKSEQNYKMALISGLVVGVIGAILWGVITVVTEYQIGYMAIAIGAGVGYSMRYFGKGMDQIFGITGAIIAVLSCVLGNFLSTIGFIANAENLSYVDTLLKFDYAQFIPLLTETFQPMDLLFYGFAAYEGYKFSFRVFEEGDFA